MHGDVDAAARPGPRGRAGRVRARELQHTISMRSKKRKEGTSEGAVMMIADDDNGANRAEEEDDEEDVMGTGGMRTTKNSSRSARER